MKLLSGSFNHDVIQQYDPPADAAVPARLVLVGNIRCFSIDMGDITLSSGETRQGTIDVTNGVGTLEFVPAGTAWTDNGMGGNVTSN